MRAELMLSSKREDTPYRVLKLREAVTKGLVETRAYGAVKEPASEATKDDARINHADGSVLPGTYVTTQADGLRITNGKEPVERYALPNPDPAVHRFWLKPPARIQVRRGTVQPANGHQGGRRRGYLRPWGPCQNQVQAGPNSSGIVPVRLTLDSSLIEKLRRLPESGMGYQRVRVHLRDGRVLQHAVVLNGELWQLDDDAGDVRSPDIVDLELGTARR